MDLTEDEQVSPRLRCLSDQLTELGWYTECSPARSTWTRATIEADHASGARALVTASWSRKLTKKGRHRWSARAYRYWFSPPPSGGMRSDWYFVQPEGLLLEMAAKPHLPVPLSSLGHGAIPRQETGCNCGKLRYYGVGAAKAALMRAQMARAGGMLRRRENNYYRCPQDSAAFHLTSRET